MSEADQTQNQTLDKSSSRKAATDTVWQKFEVPYEYPVCFTDSVFDSENPLFVDTLARLEPAKKHRFVVFVDEGVAGVCPDLVDQIRNYAQVHADRLELATDPVIIPAGENLKSELHYIEQLQKVLFDCHIDRHSYVIGLGGGALLDAVGLVAATSHRGIRHVRIPTTVLGQNDSGVGVKNGVNLFGQKNYVGTFAPPFAVLNDYDFIATLPDRDKIAGMAEAVKVSLIRDGEFFSWMEKHSDDLVLFNADAMRYMIKRCAELHMNQIANGGDPFESGSARPLDYGHWSAHKLEGLTRYHVRHGEAVAIGLALDTHYSVLKGLLPAGDDERVCFLLEHLGFRLWHPALLMEDRSGKLEILKGLVDFREHLGGELTITLLEAIGQGIEVHEIDDELVRQSMDWLQARYQDQDGNSVGAFRVV